MKTKNQVFIKQNEWIFVVIMSVIMAVITTAPYLYGYFTAPEDKVFTGVSFLSITDTPVYYSYIEQVKAGNFLFENLFTSEPTNIRNLNILWLDVGMFARIFHLPTPIAFQIYRIICIFLFLVVLYLFISRFFEKRKQRFFCFTFALFASGVGGLAAPFIKPYLSAGYYHWPMDLWVTESNIFLTLYQSPHFIVSLGLMLLSIIFVLKNNLKMSFLSGLCLLFLFQFHPYYAPFLYVLFGVYLLWRGKPLNFLPIFLISLPSVLYHAYLLNFDFPTFVRAMQTQTLTTEWWLTLISYGFLLVFAVWSAIQNFKKEKYQFLILWMIIGFTFLYLPIPFQRRFTEGLSIPMIILSSVVIFEFLYRRDHALPRLYICIFALATLFLFSNVFNYTRAFGIYQKKDMPYYVSKNVIEKMYWMRDNLDENTIVLSTKKYSAFIPGFSGRRVFFGHWSETAFPAEKEKLVDKFFDDDVSDEWKDKFLKDNKIDYIFYD
ncbi:MAG: hypothetical protein U9P90_03815 [Patescibacteria group bacterium]|nr:hypothetical protein [Patescibacteria group bacterium]